MSRLSGEEVVGGRGRRILGANGHGAEHDERGDDEEVLHGYLPRYGPEGAFEPWTF